MSDRSHVSAEAALDKTVQTAHKTPMDRLREAGDAVKFAMLLLVVQLVACTRVSPALGE